MKKEIKSNWYTATAYAKELCESRQTIYTRMNAGKYGIVIINGTRLIDVNSKNNVTINNLYTFSALAQKLGVKIPTIGHRVLSGKYKMIEVHGNKLIEYEDCL